MALHSEIVSETFQNTILNDEMISEFYSRRSLSQVQKQFQKEVSEILLELGKNSVRNVFKKDSENRSS